MSSYAIKELGYCLLHNKLKRKSEKPESIAALVMSSVWTGEYFKVSS